MLVIFQCIRSFANIFNRSPTSQTRHQHISSPTSVRNIDATEYFSAIELNEYVQVDKIEECLYAIESGENEFIEIRIQDKPEVIYQFETLIRSNTDYARLVQIYQRIATSKRYSV